MSARMTDRRSRIVGLSIDLGFEDSVNVAEETRHPARVFPRALFTGFMPMMDGVLDDHVESWYLTGAQPPPAAEVGLADVVDLTLSEKWLEPPARVDP